MRNEAGVVWQVLCKSQTPLRTKAMNDTTVWTTVISGDPVAKRPRVWRWVAFLSGTVSVVGAAAALWLGAQQREVLAQWASAAPATAGSAQADGLARLQELQDWSSLAVSTVAVAGGTSLVAFVLTLWSWRRFLRKRFEARESEWQGKVMSLDNELLELRKATESLSAAKAELTARSNQLAGVNATLQDELDKRTRAEQALTRKRQELEISKSVLEVHVQARTQDLQKLQRRYEMILNSAGEGICGMDLEGKATFVNPAVARLTGWPLEELVGKTEQEIFFPHATNGHSSSQKPEPGEQVFYRRDGTKFPVEYVKTAITENGRVVGAVLMFKDITERKRADETLTQRAAELARSNSELEQFAFVASHDLQEPLRKIQAFGDRLKGKSAAVLAPEAVDYLDRMQGAASRMRTLIDDLLAFSRVIRSSEPFVPVDLVKVTKEVLGDLEVRIEKSGAQVEVGDLPSIEADATQMHQLMLNLIGNALKFQMPGARPVVKVQSRLLASASGEPLCELTVYDNGIGFDEKYSEKIFAVFQRLHGREQYEGTGVGLAVCRRIVDRHHGAIVARSKPGEGATFIVTLPLRQGEGAAVNAAAAEPAAKS